MIVDTNVLLDITEQDENWADWSQSQIGDHATRLVINPLIYTELCYESGDAQEVDDILLMLGLRYEEIPRSALFWQHKLSGSTANVVGQKPSFYRTSSLAPMPPRLICPSSPAISPATGRIFRRWRSFVHKQRDRAIGVTMHRGVTRNRTEAPCAPQVNIGQTLPS